MHYLNFLLLAGYLFLSPEPKGEKLPTSIYDFKVEALNGGMIDFSQFKGKKILIVNTASLCGYTPQYKALEAVYEKYKDRLVIVGFPANNFGSQEPGSNSEIAGFCKKNYGVSFPMAAKISVKGDNIAPIYQWLTQKSYNGYNDNEVKWNFQKYLFDEQGQMVAMYPSNITPDSKEVIGAIEKPKH